MTKEEADNNKPESTTANNARNKGSNAKAQGNHVQKTTGPPKIEFSGVCTVCACVCGRKMRAPPAKKGQMTFRTTFFGCFYSTAFSRLLQPEKEKPHVTRLDTFSVQKCMGVLYIRRNKLS